MVAESRKVRSLICSDKVLFVGSKYSSVFSSLAGNLTVWWHPISLNVSMKILQLVIHFV